MTSMTSVAAQGGACPVVLKTMTAIGCFSSSDPLVDQGSYMYQSAGYCQCACAKINKPVMATTAGSNCYCGDLLPDSSSTASNASCNSPCDGYGTDSCGGIGFWSVALTGVESSVGSYQGSQSSTSTTVSPTTAPSESTTHAPSVITQAGQTIVITASSTPSSSSRPSTGGSNTAGIAAGVVVGAVLIAAIVGGGLYYLKQRKRKAVEEEYHRNATVKEFVAGKKSETSSTNDARLDPSVMAHHRRMSNGSIADETDFSRRILQVRSIKCCCLNLSAKTMIGTQPRRSLRWDRTKVQIDDELELRHRLLHQRPGMGLADDALFMVALNDWRR